MIDPACRQGKEKLRALANVWLPLITAVIFSHSLQGQILAPTPAPQTGPTPPGVHVPSVIPAPTPYPDASVPSVTPPTGVQLPGPYPTPFIPAIPSAGPLPSPLPQPQPPPTAFPSDPSSSPSAIPYGRPDETPSTGPFMPAGAQSPPRSPHTPPPFMPSGSASRGTSFPSSGPAPSIPLHTPSGPSLTPSGTSSPLQGGPAPSIPLNTPPSPPSTQPKGLLPSYLQPSPFPSVPFATPPSGVPFPPSPTSSGTSNMPGGGTGSSFPASLLPPTPNPAVPTASIPRIRIARTTELDSTNAPKLTLDGAVKFALAHNPDILNAVEQIRATRGQYISIRSQLLPQLVATGSFGGQSPILTNPPRPKRDLGGVLGIDTTTSSSDLANLTGNLNNYAWSIRFGVQQLVFDGGGALSSTRAARYLEDQTYFLLRSVIDKVIAQVKVAFFQVILNRSLIIVQEQSVALLENQLEDQESRYQAGTVPKFNVLQAQVAVANAVPPLITARNNLRISQYQLVKILGMDYLGDASKIPFNVVGDLTVTFRNIIPEESIRIGLTRSPTLKAQRESILSTAAGVTAALSGYYPQIVFGGGMLAQNNYYFQNIGNTVEGWFFGFTGTWNIFDGLKTYGKVATAKAQLGQAKISYDNSVRSVILEIQQDISYLQQAQETIESQQASVVQATEALRLARERLDAGAGTQLDVLNAQVALLQAQTTVLQAKFSYLQALAQYDAALSLSTQYVETFRDPLENKEKWRFARLNGAGYHMPALPRVYRNQDPVRPILGPTPSPTPPPRRHTTHPQHTARSTPSPAPQ